jgi:hypothetical protein
MDESTSFEPMMPSNHQDTSVLGKRDRSELEAEPEPQRRVSDDRSSDSDSDLDQSESDDDESAEDEEYYSESETDESGAPFGQWPAWVTFVPEPREQERPFTAQEQVLPECRNRTLSRRCYRFSLASRKMPRHFITQGNKTAVLCLGQNTERNGQPTIFVNENCPTSDATNGPRSSAVWSLYDRTHRFETHHHDSEPPCIC